MIRAIAVERSKNEKVGDASATYVGQGSCPTCPLRGNGCYAETGHVGMVTNRLEDATGTPAQFARSEARAIEALPGDRPLRLHVVGDARTPAAARILARAASGFRMRGRALGAVQPVWTYTHAWAAVPRSSWGDISVLASCESAEQVKIANRRRYAAAIVVDRFTNHKRHTHNGVSIIPCPAQTRGVQCVDCRLCLNDRKLRAIGATIAFEAHGSGAGKVRRSLPMLDVNE